MKQLIQSYRTGALDLAPVPPPAGDENGLLIATTASLVSAGTEKMIVDIAKKSLLGNAGSDPTNYSILFKKFRKYDLKKALEVVF